MTLRASRSKGAIACASIHATAVRRCALLDYSVTGVRLELPENIALPAQVHVLIGDLAHNARIVWRRGTTVGVDFIDEHHSIF